jgi:hypothetical protein
MPYSRRRELKGSSNSDDDNSDPPSQHLKGSHQDENVVRKAQETDFLAAEFELIRALPEINAHCVATLNDKCSKEILHNAPDQAQCWGCDPTTGLWMGDFIAYIVLTGLEK